MVLSSVQTRAIAGVAVILGEGCLFPSLAGLGGDGGASDAASDAQPADATDATDAANDAGRFCNTVSPTPTYCEDFDEPDGAPDISTWSYTAAGGGSLQVVTTSALSQPRSLFVDAPATSTTAVQAAVYVALGSTPTSHAELIFDVELVPGDTDTAFCGLISNAGTTVYIIAGPSGIALQEGAYSSAPTYPSHPSHAVPWATSGWVHVDVTLKRTSAGTATTSLLVNGSPLETDYPCDSRFTFGAPIVGLGFIYDAAAAAARHANIDNVVAYNQ